MGDVVEIGAIKVVNTDKLFYSKDEIIKEWGMGKTYADKFIKAFRDECNRQDSIFPNGSYIEVTPCLRWCNRKAFIYFMEHYKDIRDSNARKFVEPYRVNNKDFKRLYE